MPSPLTQAGAIPPSSAYAPIHTNRFFTGMWTQRNPLREAAVPYLLEKFYAGARFDSLIDGGDVEITNKLTLARRPGHRRFTATSYTNGNRFYAFRRFNADEETIRVAFDILSSVRDITGGFDILVRNKTAGAGSTFFQSVGNTCFMGDGVDATKWLFPTLTWEPNTRYNVGDYFIWTPGPWLLQVTAVAGDQKSGGLVPAFNHAALGDTTVDNNVTWTYRGDWVQLWGVDAPATAPTLSLAAGLRTWLPSIGPLPVATSLIDSNGFLQRVFGVPGITGLTEPVWGQTPGVSLTPDFGITWMNSGKQITWDVNKQINVACWCVDTNGNVQAFVNGLGGTTSAAPPVWNAALNGVTVDNLITWVNCGPAGQCVYNFYEYAYSYHTVDGHVSTASPLLSFGQVIGSSVYDATLTVPASPLGQVDKIWIWRTTDGGATLLKAGEVANPYAGTTTFHDTVIDDKLVVTIQAPIEHSNDRPVNGITGMAYHLSRIFGYVGNTIYFSNAAVPCGSPVQSFRPIDFFICPSAVRRLWPTAIGLIVFTASDVYIILGNGTAQSPLYIKPFLEGIGLLNWDAFAVRGTTAYFMTSSFRVLSFDPGAGIEEVGFPIGDQFNAANHFTTGTVYITWHDESSADSALYVGNGTDGWFRLAATAPPESGFVWSPKATIAGNQQCKAILSVETTPGIHELLVAPGGTNRPIFIRDRSKNLDYITAYSPFAVIGSVTLAQPGQIAELEFLTADTVRVGTRLHVAILLGEISGRFEEILRSCADPPLLPPSLSLFNDRYIMSQNQQPTFCRHLQIKFWWNAEDAANELLGYGLFGALHQEKRE